MVEPFVTIIMPVHNEALYIARSLSAVLQQTYPPDRMEIIVVDGLSTDATRKTIFDLHGSERVTVLPNLQRFQSAGMNRGILAGHGDIVIRVDGHTVIAPNYVRRCVELLTETGAANVGGGLHPIGWTAMGRAIAAASKSAFAVPTIFRFSQTSQYVDTVYLGAWWRSIFDEVGLFDEKLAVNEDYELNYRIRKAGGTILFAPEICSEYYGQQTLHGLFGQYWRYGYWKPRVLQKHPASMRARHLAAPLFVASITLGSMVASPVGVLTILCYLLINFLFSVQIAKCSSQTWKWQVPLVFATIHLAWGLGFWHGLFSLLLRGNSS